MEKENVQRSAGNGKEKEKQKIRCRYKDKCPNKSCPFKHPNPKPDEIQINNENSSIPCGSTKHSDGELVTVDNALVGSCNKKEKQKIPCRHKGQCPNKMCPFEHPNPKFDGMQINNENSSNPSAPKKQSGESVTIDNVTNESYSNKKESRLCHFGNTCRNYYCKFDHPDTKSTASTTRSKDLKPRKKEFHKEREIRALNSHKNRISSIKERIVEIFASLIADERNVDNNNIAESADVLDSQINQLNCQVTVYQKVKARAEETFSHNYYELDGQIERELFRLESSLPVFAKRLEIDRLFESNPRVIIIQGQTGSGKSTQIPQYIADHPIFFGKRIVCTQPRKIAAEALANRVAFEYSGGFKPYRLGQHVGYHVGGLKVLEPNCRIEFVTEGVMLERIMKNDPKIFNKVGCIIIDEAHERSITCDILLGSFKKADPRWKDVLIIVMSATIDLKLFANYFQGAPVLEIEGRTFPVKTIYKPVGDNAELRKQVSMSALEIHRSCKKETGDILCFLPGQEDVLLAQAQFEREIGLLKKPEEFLLTKALALYGKQDPKQQALVFEKLPDNTRKVIFSTDLAETSVTIDGVKFVVDSGVKKEVIYDPKRNISSLKVNTISRSSAIQRAGRSGRTQPGICYRLYSEDDFEKMCVNTAPEIFRKQLSVAVLTLREMKIDPVDFDWISAPSKEALAAAEEELKMLKAIDCDNKTTELGRLISLSQQDPKLVKMIHSGCKDGFGLAALTIASIMTVSNIFFWHGTTKETKAESKKLKEKFLLPEGDFVTMYRVFQQWLSILEEKQSCSESKEDVSEDNNPNRGAGKRNKKEAGAWCMKNSINGKAMNLAYSTRSDFTLIFKRSAVWKNSKSQDREPTNIDLQKIIFAGYFLQTAHSILTKNISSPTQYHALHSDVSGKLDYNSAFLNKSDKSFKSPQWIVYDRIFRLAVTIFPCTSAIEQEWLQEESPEFYQICMDKLQHLPTEAMTKFLSQACLQSLMGKYYCNLESLEDELGCSILADGESGQLTAFCSVSSKPTIEESLERKLSHVIRRMKNETVEEEYLGGCRVVIGQGYEIKCVLFPQEFTTIYIRNIPKNCRQNDVDNLLQQTRVTPLSVEFMKQKDENSAIAKFISKREAKLVLDQLKEEAFLQGKQVNVVPKLGPRKGVSQGIASRLKLSWAAKESTGVATIWFNSPAQANLCIENFRSIFPGGSVTMVHGDVVGKPRNPNRNDNFKGKPSPPLISILHRFIQGVCRYRFDTETITTIYGDINRFEYIITVAELPHDFDEYEITKRIQKFNPRWVKVKRGKMDRTELNAEEKKEKLRFISRFIEQDGSTHSDFFDGTQGRAGITIYFNNNSLAKDAYEKRIDYNVWTEKPFGQPHRLEIEFIHRVSIHVDLFYFLADRLQEFKLDAKCKNVMVNENHPKNNRSKFVFVSCRTSRQASLLWVQEQLNAITTPVKFEYEAEKISLLFTWTGKAEMAKLSEKAYIHFNDKNHWIWIYGSDKVKEEISNEITKIINSLSVLEFIDHPIDLDKKIVNVDGKEGGDIRRMCERNNIKHFRFHGSKMYLSGSKSDIENIKLFLERNFFKRKRCYSTEERECGLCFDLCDGKFIVTSLCGHLFCLECIQPMFSQSPPPFPIICPTCEIPVALNDILKCAPAGSLQKILEVAVNKYQEGNEADVRLCPTHGCSQFLSYSSRTTGIAGGEFIFCDVCMTTYCIGCSAKLEKPVKSHEGESCEDVQSGIAVEISKLVRDIQEKILNLNCPRCKKPFFEFDGCAAVQCGSCSCNFCGLCFEDCGSNAHSHVIRCPKNSQQNFFVDRSHLNKVHRDLRIQKIKDYILQAPSLTHATAIKALNSLRKDLKDLGIDIEEFIQLVNEKLSDRDLGNADKASVTLGEGSPRTMYPANEGGRRDDDEEERQQQERIRQLQEHRLRIANEIRQVQLRPLGNARQLRNEILLRQQAERRERELHRQLEERRLFPFAEGHQALLRLREERDRQDILNRRRQREELEILGIAEEVILAEERRRRPVQQNPPPRPEPERRRCIIS